MRMVVPKTVLVVDDELMVRLFLSRLLQEQGYAVRAASSGAAGLFLLGNSPGEIDLILTDLNMPGMSGVDFALHVRRRWPEIPVAVMTGSPLVNVPSDEPFDFPVVEKPFVAELLLELLDTLAAAHHSA